MSLVTAHMVYFCAFARSDLFPKNARELGVGRGQFHSGVNGLNKFSFVGEEISKTRASCFIGVSKHSKTIKASVFSCLETPMKQTITRQ